MKTKRILILGAYGNFGRHITAKLAFEENIQLIFAGRSLEKCQALAAEYQQVPLPPEIEVFDIFLNFHEHLKLIKPDVVIHTCGPFQAQDYTICEACITHGCHYIDLADGREYVEGILKLNQRAQEKKVCIISGASSVPCLTSAVVDHFIPQFNKLYSIDSGIATAQRLNVGLATMRGTLSYSGKPINVLKNSVIETVYGWQGIKKHTYPIIGRRYLSYCDIPDLALFHKRYPDLKSHVFYVSLEVTIVHWTMWALSWLARFKLLRNLPSKAPLMRKMAHWFDKLGSNNSGFHVQMCGMDHEEQQKKITFYLIALDKYGPYIPSMPAILCAKKLARDEINHYGAYPCIGLISLEEYLNALDSKKIKAQTIQDK